MKTEIIVAIIAGGATILAAVIAGVFNLVSKKTKNTGGQKIQGNGNIQAGRNITISGGVNTNDDSSNKRK